MSDGTEDLRGDVFVTQGIIVIPSTTVTAGMMIQKSDGLFVPIVTSTEVLLLLVVDGAVLVVGVTIGTTSRGTDGSVGPVARITGGGASVDVGIFHLVIRNDSLCDVMDGIVRRLEGANGELL